MNVFADQPLQHLVRLENNMVKIEHFGLHDLLAAEGEELAGEGGCSLSGFPDRFEFAIQRIILPEASQGEINVAVDDREKVVEVVGHPARQLSDSLHFLRLSELFLALAQSLFGLFARRDVSSDSEYLVRR